LWNYRLRYEKNTWKVFPPPTAMASADRMKVAGSGTSCTDLTSTPTYSIPDKSFLSKKKKIIIITNNSRQKRIAAAQKSVRAGIVEAFYLFKSCCYTISVLLVRDPHTGERNKCNRANISQETSEMGGSPCEVPIIIWNSRAAQQ
jgi:hypothetical protein